MARLAEAASVQHAPRGTLLVTEGDAAEHLGVVSNGRLRMFHRSAEGRTIVLQTAERGEAVGAIAVLAGGRHPADIDAATPATVVWVPRDALLEMAEREPGVARGLITDLAAGLVNLTNVVQTLALDVPGRLARYLFQRSLAAGQATADGLLVPLGMTKTELAASLGTVPETLSRALGRLRDDGVLEVRGGEVLVYDVGALARLGSGYEG